MFLPESFFMRQKRRAIHAKRVDVVEERTCLVLNCVGEPACRKGQRFLSCDLTLFGSLRFFQAGGFGKQRLPQLMREGIVLLCGQPTLCLHGVQDYK